MHTKRKEAVNVQICPGGALQQALQFQLEWKLGHDMPHHKPQQPLVCEHFHHSPTAGHRGQLKMIVQVKIKIFKVHANNLMKDQETLQMIWEAWEREGFDRKQILARSRTDIRTSTTLSVNLFKNSTKMGSNVSEIADPGRAKRSPTNLTAFKRMSNWSVCKWWNVKIKRSRYKLRT